MNKIEGTQKRIQMIIHNCYEYGHIWKIIEEPFYYISVCRICGKIGDRKKK